jgi:hypothetical protein
MTTNDSITSRPQFQKSVARLAAYYFYIAGVLVAMLATAVLVSAEAQAQQVQPAQATDGPAKTRYSTSDIARAFGFIDANKDGKLSREEASGFRNIAKHFDTADTNQDGSLSIEEFTSALNKP